MWGLCFVRNFCYLFHSLVYTHSKQFGWIHNCMNWSPIKLEVYHQLWLNLQVFSFHIIKWSAKPLLKAFHFLVFSQAYFYPKIWIAGTKSLCGGQVCTINHEHTLWSAVQWTNKSLCILAVGQLVPKVQLPLFYYLIEFILSWPIRFIYSELSGRPI